MNIATQLVELRDFLVPMDGPDKLVKHWINLAEDKEGTSCLEFDAAAVRFCIWGGMNHLWEERLHLVECFDLRRFLRNYAMCHNRVWGIRRIFFFSEHHSPRQVRKFLNSAIKYAEKQEK